MMHHPIFLYKWLAVLALLGIGKHLMNRTGRFAAYMGGASYPVYILHQHILVAIAYYVLFVAFPPAIQYILIVIISLLLTFACYEVIRRIPGVRWHFGSSGAAKKNT